MGVLGPRAQEAVPALEQLHGHSDRLTRDSAHEALARIDPTRFAPAAETPDDGP